MLDRCKILRELIAKNETKRAINEMEHLIHSNPGLRNRLIIQQAKFERTTQRYAKGVIKKDDESIQQNEVVEELLNIIDELENSYLVLNHMSGGSHPSNVGKELRIDQVVRLIQGQEKSKKKYWIQSIIYALVASFLIIIVIIYLNRIDFKIPMILAIVFFSLIGGSIPYRQIIKGNRVIDTLKILKSQLELLPDTKNHIMIHKIDDLLWKIIENELLAK